jgi:diguanylate cyclase
MRESLAEVLSGAPGARARPTLERCLEEIGQVGAALRGLAQLRDPARLRTFARESGDLHALTTTLRDTVAELGEANQRVGAELGQHVGELDRLAELPPEEEIAPRLASTVSSARQVAGEARNHVSSASNRLRKATERINTLERALKEAKERAAYDALTRLHSRAALDEHLDEAVRRGGPAGPWCLLLLDIDHFKRVNDTHGHVVGDALLHNVARVIERSVRWKADQDFLARYGGEEFAVVLGQATPQDAAAVAERLRKAVAEARWEVRNQDPGGVVSVTVSIGVAPYRQGDAVVDLVCRADGALYEAKGTGRNRVVVAEP